MHTFIAYIWGRSLPISQPTSANSIFFSVIVLLPNPGDLGKKKHFLTYNFQRNQATILSVCIAHDNFKQKGTHNSLVHCEDTEYANKRIYEWI